MREINPDFSVHDLENDAKGFYDKIKGIFEMAYNAYL